MRRHALRWAVLVPAVTALLMVGSGLHTGSAHALQIGSIAFPEVDPPATIDQSKPTVISTPEWAPELSAAQGDVVIMIPGTTDYDGTDQTARTLGIGLFGGVVGTGTDAAYVDTSSAAPVTVVDYPAAFGLDPFGFPIYLAGTDTFSHSVQEGTVNGVAAAINAYDPQNADQKVVINGYSQSAPIAMNVAYALHRTGAIPDENVVVIVGADSRFPNTGVENVVPSFLPGMYTNGNRDTADTGDIAVYSYCVRGDATCGVGNPLVNPISTFFYLLPGFYVHGFLTYRINEYEVSDSWTDGNTTYIVYDGGNPWGMMLRDLGFWFPEEFDDALSTVVPVPMPGHRSTLADLRIPMPDELRSELAAHTVATPRELQELIYASLGIDVPVHDPDACTKTPSACQADYGDLLDAASASGTVPVGSTRSVSNSSVIDESSSVQEQPAEDSETAPSTSTESVTPDLSGEISDEHSEADAASGEAILDGTGSDETPADPTTPTSADESGVETAESDITTADKPAN